MNKTPEISEGLLKYLDQKFPDRCPEPSQKARRIWMAAGAREVIRHLQALHKEQNPNVYARPQGTGTNATA